MLHIAFPWQKRALERTCHLAQGRTRRVTHLWYGSRRKRWTHPSWVTQLVASACPLRHCTCGNFAPNCKMSQATRLLAQNVLFKHQWFHHITSITWTDVAQHLSEVSSDLLWKTHQVHCEHKTLPTYFLVGLSPAHYLKWSEVALLLLRCNE